CRARGVQKEVSTIFFITHPDVAIDPSVPVPDWPLNERGRARMQAVAAWPWASGVRRIFASSEQKARDGAQILADTLGLDGYSVVDDLGENDRSATGYLAKQEFEATADAFFAHPQESVRGWEPAVIAEARIVCAVEQIVSQICGHFRVRAAKSAACRLGRDCGRTTARRFPPAAASLASRIKGTSAGPPLPLII